MYVNNGEMTNAKNLSNILFEPTVNVNFSSYLQNRVQFDSNSCGAWLTAGVECYLLGYTWEYFKFM